MQITTQTEALAKWPDEGAPIIFMWRGQPVVFVEDSTVNPAVHERLLERGDLAIEYRDRGPYQQRDAWLVLTDQGRERKKRICEPFG